MSYNAFQTEDGIEIRDGEDVITTVNTWPPRNKDDIDDLLNHADISDPIRSVLIILLGVGNLIDETPNEDET